MIRNLRTGDGTSNPTTSQCQSFGLLSSSDLMFLRMTMANLPLKSSSTWTYLMLAGQVSMRVLTMLLFLVDNGFLRQQSTGRMVQWWAVIIVKTRTWLNLALSTCTVKLSKRFSASSPQQNTSQLYSSGPGRLITSRMVSGSMEDLVIG